MKKNSANNIAFIIFLCCTIICGLAYGTFEKQFIKDVFGFGILINGLLVYLFYNHAQTMTNVMVGALIKEMNTEGSEVQKTQMLKVLATHTDAYILSHYDCSVTLFYNNHGEEAAAYVTRIVTGKHGPQIRNADIHFPYERT